MNALEARIARIQSETGDLLSTANLLVGLRENSPCWTSPAFDVRRAIKNLRETANKLEAICERAQD